VGDVALAHDYLNQFGGGERVAVELTKIWPDAPLYTSLYRPHSTFDHFRGVDVRTSWIDRLPVDRRFRALLPLMPSAIRSLGELDVDLLVASSSGWAHGIRTAPRAFRVVYCHNPARWIYEADGYLPRPLARAAARPLLSRLRAWDQRQARTADLYIANSSNVQGKIKRTYGIEAPVVHPPADVERFTPRPPGDRLLVVSRLLPYKRVDLVVRAATRSGMALDVVGTGPELDALRALAGPSVTFHGRLDDGAVTELMESCRALCFPGVEDFGITPLEANAAGKPVVAYAAGGVLETMIEGRTATFFREPAAATLLDAIERLEDLDTSPEELAAHAGRFSPAAFAENLLGTIERHRSPGR
jgi:glycosyltransferase involved in cell wall biosynthesis